MDRLAVELFVNYAAQLSQQLTPAQTMKGICRRHKMENCEYTYHYIIATQLLESYFINFDKNYCSFLSITG